MPKRPQPDAPTDAQPGAQPDAQRARTDAQPGAQPDAPTQTKTDKADDQPYCMAMVTLATNNLRCDLKEEDFRDLAALREKLGFRKDTKLAVEWYHGMHGTNVTSYWHMVDNRVVRSTCKPKDVDAVGPMHIIEAKPKRGDKVGAKQQTLRQLWLCICPGLVFDHARRQTYGKSTVPRIFALPQSSS